MSCCCQSALKRAMAEADELELDQAFPCDDEQPPSYEEAIAAISRLFCKDFWPNCQNAAEKAKYGEYESFDAVMSHANDWLCVHPECHVIKCETVWKKVYTVSDIYNGSMIFERQGKSSVIVYGLRIWTLCHGVMSSSRITQLSCVDLVPQCLHFDPNRPEWENLTTVIENFNEQNRINPIGNIVTVDTVSLELVATDEYWVESIDTKRCAWIDVNKKHRLNFLRVFYQIGTPSPVAINVTDFIPEGLEKRGFWGDKPNFAPFGTVFSEAREWIKHHKGIKIVNLQTLTGKFLGFYNSSVDSDDEDAIASQTAPVDTLSGLDTKVEKYYIVSFLRVVYSFPQKDEREPEVIPEPPDLGFRSFLPETTSLRYQEDEYHPDYGPLTMGHTVSCLMDRVHQWLRRADGARIFMAETVTVPQKFLIKAEGIEKMVRSGNWWYRLDQGDGNYDYHRYHLVQFVRLYLNGGFVIPMEDIPYSTPNWLENDRDEDCSIL